MRHMPVKAIVVGLVLFPAAIAFTQDLNPLDPVHADIIRVEHQHDRSLPDGIAFRNVLRMLVVMAGDEDEVGIQWVQSRMGLVHEEARSMAIEMQAALTDLVAATENAHRATSCPSDGSRATGDDVYALLDALDDISAQIAAQHLLIFKAKIGVENAARLQQFLDIEKTKMTYIKFDHKKLYEKRGANADEVLATFCASIESLDGSMQR